MKRMGRDGQPARPEGKIGGFTRKNFTRSVSVNRRYTNAHSEAAGGKQQNAWQFQQHSPNLAEEISKQHGAEGRTGSSAEADS